MYAVVSPMNITRLSLNLGLPARALAQVAPVTGQLGELYYSECTAVICTRRLKRACTDR